jgi:hypothetical protein
MNFWRAAAAEYGTISLSEECADDGHREISVGLEEGMRRFLPKLISLPIFVREFSANEVEFSANEVEFLPKLISLPIFVREFSANEVEFSANEVEFSANEVEFSARSASRLGEEVKKPPLPDTAPSLPRPLASSISCVGGAGS